MVLFPAETCSASVFWSLGFTYFHLHPYLGPISGNTTVLVESATVPVGASSSIRCRFGTLTVPGVRVNDTYLQCVSPAVVTPGEVKFEVALNQQDFVEAERRHHLVAPCDGMYCIVVTCSNK